MSDPTTLHGHCYCGGVQFDVTLDPAAPPIFTAYCNCDSCRRAHAAPLFHVCASRSEQYTVTAGAELINDFQKPGAKVIRGFCSQCGSRLYNKFPQWRPKGFEAVAWFPNLLTEGALQPMPELLRPMKMAFEDECVLDRGFLSEWLERQE